LFKVRRAAADTKSVATQVSAPIRIVALVALLAALAMGAWLMTAGRGGTESADAVVPLQAVNRADAVASNLTARNTATAAGKATRTAPAAAAPAAAKPAAAKAAAKPAASKQAQAVPAPSAKPVRKLAVNLPKGTPTTIAGLLANHAVVVVLLYDTNSKVDQYSLSEAVLGAKNAGAGFLRVDVRDQKQASPFTNAYGVLQDPSVLVFKRPGTLSIKLSGFADHETVAQAATNAARDLKTPAR
jgi:hypothetical protein